MAHNMISVVNVHALLNDSTSFIILLKCMMKANQWISYIWISKTRLMKLSTNDCLTNYWHTVFLVTFTIGFKTGFWSENRECFK